jgi:hypothetical protein
MTGRLPQLLRQLHRWLDTEQHAGRLRSDDTTDPARIVTRATAELTDAGHAANDLNRALDTAHQHLSHLAATEPDRAHEPEPSHTRRSAVPSMRARAWRRPGRNGWPPVGTFVATSGQVSWPPVGRNRCPLTITRPEGTGTGPTDVKRGLRPLPSASTPLRCSTVEASLGGNHGPPTTVPSARLSTARCGCPVWACSAIVFTVGRPASRR